MHFMLTLFGKKKITEEKAAHIVINGIQILIDEGFGEVVGLINDSPEFVRPPSIHPDDSGPFTLIVLAGNLQIIPDYFEAGRDKRISRLIMTKLAELHDQDGTELAQSVNDMRKFMMRKNHPSKSVTNAMARAIFCKYGLNEFQENYFKSLSSPNPIFIQRLREAMENFLWEWDSMLDRYRVVQAV
jgi:hypothetical protein